MITLIVDPLFGEEPITLRIGPAVFPVILHVFEGVTLEVEHE